MKYFKHLLFLSILCSLVLFINCGEDSEDPVADTPTNNTDDDNTDDGSTDPVNYTLTLTASEGGTVTPESGSFGENEAVELLATPDSTYVFVNWTGSSTSTVNPLSVTMDADKSYTANFVKKQYPLTIIVEGEGAVYEEIVTNGRVEDYDDGTIVQLTAFAQVGWKFDIWEELGVTTNTLEVTITEAITLTAKFYVPIDSVSLTPSALQMILGDTDTLKASIYPSNISDTINWKSSDESIATVTQNGIVTAIAKGEAVITVMTAKDSISNTAQITVILDADKDGVIDENDTCADTPDGTVTDVNGCPLPAIYLDDNGVTVKARDFAVVGESYELDGVSYKVADWDYLWVLRENNDWERMSRVVTTKLNSFPYNFWYKKSPTMNTLKSWDVSNFTNMKDAFKTLRSSDLDLSYWDVSNVTNMEGMFADADYFIGDISTWDVTNVTDMSAMFLESFEFNGDISSWDVSNVTDMGFMFRNASSFNQDISSWKISNTKIISMFERAYSFNQDISNWDVSNITDMSGMFRNATSFNQDISNWDVSNVNNMSEMFKNTTSFNQDISSWDVSNVTTCYYFSANATAWIEPKPNFTNCEE
jgi:uncharacterized repeat protein (TIGR02543 family)